MLNGDDDIAKAAALHSLEVDAAVAGSVIVKRYKRSRSRAVVAAEYISVRTGSLRRGFAGVSFREGLWRPSGGWNSNAVQGAPANEVWLNSGGWSNDDWTVHGGWVADGSATQLRAIDPAGRVEQDTLTHGIAILIWEGDLDRESRAELLDAEGGVVRSGLVLRPRRPIVR